MYISLLVTLIAGTLKHTETKTKAKTKIKTRCPPRDLLQHHTHYPKVFQSLLFNKNVKDFWHTYNVHECEQIHLDVLMAMKLLH